MSPTASFGLRVSFSRFPGSKNRWHVNMDYMIEHYGHGADFII
jgi:hypothetical protein